MIFLSQIVQAARAAKKLKDRNPDGDLVTIIVSPDHVRTVDRMSGERHVTCLSQTRLNIVNCTGEPISKEFIKSVSFTCCVNFPDKRRDRDAFAYVSTDERLVSVSVEKSCTADLTRHTGPHHLPSLLRCAGRGQRNHASFQRRFPNCCGRRTKVCVFGLVWALTDSFITGAAKRIRLRRFRLSASPCEACYL